MRIGFFCPEVPGHLNPMTTLARRLQERGHEAVFFSSWMGEATVRAAGLDSIPFGTQYFRQEKMQADFRKLSSLQGEAALYYVFQMIADSSREIIEDGPRLIRESRVDGLVLDSIWNNLELVAMRLGVPYVHVANALHADYSGHTPFFVYDSPYEAGPAARARNLQQLQDFTPIVRSCRDVVSEYASHAGLNIDPNDPCATLSPIAQITQTPREFDFPGDHWPAHFHYAGPFHDGQGRADADFPWERLTGERLIYASMGTLMNGSEQIFKIIAEAAAGPGRQLVLSVGANVDLTAFGSLPSNAIAVSRCPQIEVLKRAALCITHAGLNTALESLAQGVPMVAIPIANDQPGVAARIAYTETGRFVRLADLTAARLRELVDEVIDGPQYRMNSQRLGAAIRKTGGLELAANIVEQAFGVRSRNAAAV